MDVSTTILRCGVCGAPLSGTGSTYTCDYCGNVSYRNHPGLEDELMAANGIYKSIFDKQQLEKQLREENPEGGESHV